MKEGFMKDLIIEQIERRARLEHGGDMNKAAAEYFRDHPKEWQRYTDEVTGVNKRAGEDREEVTPRSITGSRWSPTATNWISTSRPISWRHRRKSSPKIRICISATQLQ